MSYMIGVDVGGTFTDFSIFNQETGELFNYKDSSTPSDPSRAIVKGVKDVLEIKGAKASEVSYLAHGTTVGTNALIEKKAAAWDSLRRKGLKISWRSERRGDLLFIICMLRNPIR